MSDLRGIVESLMPITSQTATSDECHRLPTTSQIRLVRRMPLHANNLTSPSRPTNAIASQTSHESVSSDECHRMPTTSQIHLVRRMPSPAKQPHESVSSDECHSLPTTSRIPLVQRLPSPANNVTNPSRPTNANYVNATE